MNAETVRALETAQQRVEANARDLDNTVRILQRGDCPGAVIEAAECTILLWKLSAKLAKDAIAAEDRLKTEGGLQ